MASKNIVQVYTEAYSQYFDYRYKCGSTDCKFGTDNKFAQQEHAQPVKGSVGDHLAPSSLPFYRCALCTQALSVQKYGSDRAANMGPTVRQIRPSN